MKKYIFLLLPLLFANCRSIVNPNEWVVSTATCWNEMTVTKAGSAIPRLRTACDRMIILPATFMSAELDVKTKFDSRVAGNISLTYQWRIADPIKFIQNAKSLTSSPVDGDKKVDVTYLEGIENSVVDKMIIDILREYTPKMPAGTDELKIESDLFALCQSIAIQRGIEFASPSVNVEFSPQIEEALDVISALEFYKSNNEDALGRDVIRAKAGAPNTTFNTQK